MPWPIAFDDVVAAEARLRPYLPVTPMRRYPELDEAVGLRVLVKHENHQPTNAFKIRNGLAALTAMPPEDRKRGVVTASTGNHGQGVAWAGRALGVPVTICLPRGINPDKVAAMRALGAELVEEGRDYDDAVAVMQRLVSERGMTPVHGVNHPQMPCGAGTLTLELVRQAEAMGEKVDAMVIAIGGGSQAVGAMTVLRKLRPNAAVYGVQAVGASIQHDAWKRGEPFKGTAPTPVTFAEGMATRATYELTFAALHEGLTDFILVSDAELADAIRLLIKATHNLAEPAGAAGLAGLRKLAGSLAGKTVAIVVSGANVDVATLGRVVGGQI